MMSAMNTNEYPKKITLLKIILGRGGGVNIFF